jgi:hypothetical protein
LNKIKLCFQITASIIGDRDESNDVLDGLSKSAYERRIQRLEDEKKELMRKLGDSNRALQNFAHGPLAVDNNSSSTPSNDNSAAEIRKLQDDNNMLVKKNNGEFVTNIFKFIILVC